MIRNQGITSRRQFLSTMGNGFGALALGSMLAKDVCASDLDITEDPLRHIPSKVRSIVWFFLDGGPSHIDLFDPKPALDKLAGKPLPSSFPRPQTAMGITANTPLLASKRKFKQHGKSGIWMSDWLPNLARHADDMAVLRSCVGEGLTHVAGVLQMNTCSTLPGRPSLGAWSVYGLGNECDDLPSFVVLSDRRGDVPGGSRNWGSGFIPAAYQGTRFLEGPEPVLFHAPPPQVAPSRQRRKLDYLKWMNERRKNDSMAADRLEARIASYELAWKMQTSIPQVVDLSRETKETQNLYGIENETTGQAAKACLLARRLVERGVRFIQVYLGSGSSWDAHSDLEGNHSGLCRETDQPVAAFLTDLKRRGLLDETLVIWGGEFGRTPMSESGDGRDHNPYGFTMWFAGAGVKAGSVVGSTDEIGLYAVDRPAPIKDIHATILRMAGLENDLLTFRHNGRDERATITDATVVEELLG
ncbi:MAG: hypothetical protein RL595_2694 [Planctomycetota bacterium]